jgi:hypothetical protein
VSAECVVASNPGASQAFGNGERGGGKEGEVRQHPSGRETTGVESQRGIEFWGGKSCHQPPNAWLDLQHIHGLTQLPSSRRRERRKSQIVIIIINIIIHSGRWKPGHRIPSEGLAGETYNRKHQNRQTSTPA